MTSQPNQVEDLRALLQIRDEELKDTRAGLDECLTALTELRAANDTLIKAMGLLTAGMKQPSEKPKQRRGGAMVLGY